MIDKGYPLISVVIIGRNEGLRLRRCLDSVRTMNFPAENIEIIYVDTASTDDSIEIATSCGAATIEIRPQRPCAAKARNAGWRLATSPFVLFLDGDTVLDPDFVGRALGAFADPAVAVVWGRRREIHPEQSIYTGVLDLDWTASSPGETKYCGGDALFQRLALEQTGGFDDDLIAGEEPELCWRIRALGRKILLMDIQMTWHDLAITRWRQYWKRSVRTGHAYAEIADRFRGTQDPLWSQEQTRNVVQGLAYLTLAAGSIAAGLILWSPWPPVAAALVFIGLAARTALRNRTRPVSAGVLLAYGIHSHVQQIPVLVGQIQYWLGRLRGRRRTLIEYQNSTL
jgi:glycosyltransferase involved in cell wall biosynthesis